MYSNKPARIGREEYILQQLKNTKRKQQRANRKARRAEKRETVA